MHSEKITRQSRLFKSQANIMIDAKRLRLYLWCFLLLTFLLPSFVSADGGDPFYDAGGIDPFRETLGSTDFEHIDPFTGGLTLNFVDMILPGNNGLDLVIERFYNSKDACRSWEKCTGPSCSVNCLSPEDSWVGIGWSLHMGKLMVPQFVNGNPYIEMPDGSQHVAYHGDFSEYITRDYWKLVFDNSIGTWTLTLTDGRKMYFGNIDSTSGNSQYYEYYATKIEDTAGNTITIEYYDAGAAYPPYAPYAIKKITDSTGRVTNFALTARIPATYGKYRLDHITRPDGKMIHFDYQTISGSSFLAKLSGVTPPQGNSWSFLYDTVIHELTKITTPYGGEITYGYQATTSTYGGGDCFHNYRTVKTKTTSEASGSWDFSYDQVDTPGETTKDQTVVTDPCGRTTKYRHYGYDSRLDSGEMWKLGLPISKEVVGEEKLKYDWTKSVYISPDDYYTVPCGPPDHDGVIYVPYLSKQTIDRDGTTYMTSYANYDNYGNPMTIAETGNQTRTTTKTFWYNPTKNIVRNKPATETVSGSFPGTFTTNYTYDQVSNQPSGKGKLMELDKYGVVTKYTYYSTVGNLGNLWTATDANGNTTTYEWQNGQISKTTNPIYFVERGINANGMVDSVKDGRGYTTSYDYDNNLRLKQIDPPVGNNTDIYYHTDNSYKKESRGGYWLQTNFDGLGRPKGTEDSRGVTTTIAYKSCGLKDYAYSNIGDTVYYDNFGRTKKILHIDSTHIDYYHSVGNQVTVSDEENKNTILYYTAFGSPEDRMLTSVNEANLKTTYYDRNMLGNLIRIRQGSLTRSFDFNYDATRKNFLKSETHPETGTIYYGRDNVGNMTSKTDSMGKVDFGYDEINRLKNIKIGSTTISTFGYDNADNRDDLTTPAASAKFHFDAANRMEWKKETIAGREYTTWYTYDDNDNIKTITYPTGLVVTYNYDTTKNQVTSATWIGGSVTGITYNLAGQPEYFTYANGITTHITPNARFFPKQIQAGNAYDTGFTYYANGNT